MSAEVSDTVILKNRSRVRVVLPAHREGKLLSHAIESIQRQTLTDWSMSLVLDFPDSATRNTALRYAASDSRIEISEVAFRNLGAVLQSATSYVSEKYIARMDADDVALPERLEKQIRYLELNSEIVALGANVIYVDSLGRPFGKSKNQLNHRGIYEELLRGRGGAIFHPTAIFRTESLMNTAGYSDEFVRGQDLDLYLKLSEVGILANLPEHLLRFRKHSASSTAGEDIGEAYSRRVSTINRHYKRIGCDKAVGEVIRLHNVTLHEETVGRLSRALRAGFYNTALIYVWKALRNPDSRVILFKKFRKMVKGWRKFQ